jgi:hypothetical protein
MIQRDTVRLLRGAMLYEIASVDNFLRRSRGLVILPDAETGVEAKFLVPLKCFSLRAFR